MSKTLCEFKSSIISPKVQYSNEHILSLIKTNKNDKESKIIERVKNIVPLLIDTKILEVYDTIISIHQSSNSNNGKFLENIVIKILEEHKIHYRKQVTIDSTGIIVGFNIKKNKCYHVIDFVIGENIEENKSISEFKVISCKSTCRERWTQDDWSLTFAPILYVLLTMSNDYPLSFRFRESTRRKIITCLPKRNDDRKYVLNFENIIEEMSRDSVSLFTTSVHNYKILIEPQMSNRNVSSGTEIDEIIDKIRVITLDVQAPPLHDVNGLCISEERNDVTKTELDDETTDVCNESSYDISRKKVKFIDLFCGIGSFHYSFKKLSWQCVMSCDIDISAKETYEANYGLLPLGDITLIDPKNVPNYDILCAGFPCQPFSQCGQHKGFSDSRGGMFFNIMKFVNYHKPKIIVLENVMGILNHDDGKTFGKIKSDIETSGYTITYKVLKCSDYGLPQMRKRLFILGVRNNCEVLQHIDKLLDFDEYKKESTLTELLGKNFEKKTAYTIRCGGKNSPINDKHNWDGYFVDGHEYRLTKEDCLKIQGFRGDFKLCGNNRDQWKQLGNTIPTIFTEIIGLNINKFIGK